MKTGCHCLKLAGAAMALYLLMAASPVFFFSDATKTPTAAPPVTRPSMRARTLVRAATRTSTSSVRAYGTLQHDTTGWPRVRILSRAGW